MASCGAESLDEKKQSEIINEHSLDNVRAFSMKKGQMCSPSKEGLVVTDEQGKRVDRRTRIIYANLKFCYSSYLALSQITAKLPNGDKGVGSGTAIICDGKKFFLTCAHNLLGYSVLNNLAIRYTDSKIYNARQGEKSARYVFTADNKKSRVHPMYDGQPESGFDIGMIPKMEEISRMRNINLWKTRNDEKWRRDVISHSTDPNTIKKGMSVELAGYPGEKKGWPHTHTGKIMHVTKTKLGGHLIWYDSDATHGNSGSAVMITDKDFVRSITKKPGIRKAIVGIHTGHDPVEGLNYGTLITPSIMKWITNF